MNRGERLRRRRCIGLQVAVILGILLAVVNREDLLLAAIALAGIGVALVVFWRDCRTRRDSR